MRDEGDSSNRMWVGERRVHLVYLRSGGLLITKRHYRDWHDIQDSFADYMTSLGPWTIEELLCFLQEEYGLLNYEHAAMVLADFIRSDKEEMDAAELGLEE